MPVVDASVWVAINHTSDRAHRQCVGWLNSVLPSDERLFAPTLFVAEVAGALRRLTGERTAASRVVRELFELGVVELVELDAERARRAASVAEAAGARGADAVYIALAAERHQTLVTADRQQGERGRGVVEVELL